MPAKLTTQTLAELQTKTPLDPVNLARVLRLAMTNHIFSEPSPGLIAHTAASRLLAEYKQKLREHIPVVYPSNWNDARKETPDVELVAFPTRYYLVAVGSVLGVFALLHLASLVEWNVAAWMATR